METGRVEEGKAGRERAGREREVGKGGDQAGDREVDKEAVVVTGWEVVGLVGRGWVAGGMADMRGASVGPGAEGKRCPMLWCQPRRPPPRPTPQESLRTRPHSH